MGRLVSGMFRFRRRGAASSESDGATPGVLTRVGEAVEDLAENVAERIAEEWREAEREAREAEERDRLDAAADFIRAHIRRLGSWFPGD